MAVSVRDNDGTTRLSGELLATGGATGDVLTQQADGTYAPAAGGSQPGAPVVRKFSFAYNDAGLNNGIAFYTPTIDDVLLDAWVEVITAWNGTQPRGDIGTFVGTSDGLFAATGTFVGLTHAAASDQGYGEGVLVSLFPTSLAALSAYNGYRLAPSKFTAANPLKIVVSQTGAAGGAAPGASQGAANIFLVTATPA